jgi:NADH-quinone oxidoreductase subunit F
MNEILLNGVDLNDPSLAAYRRRGGYEGLRRALRSSSKEIVEEIRRSGLRGRGGGGFPAGLKWKGVLEDPSPEKYVVANGAEGEPGSLKDRFLMKRLPHPILEGLWIAAHVLKARRAFLFVNGHFKEAIDACRKALSETEQGSFLADLFGETSPIPLELFEGPDDYLAGEETALLEWMQGRPAIPRQKPPYYPGTFGLFGKPTLVNNVETLANVPEILRRGAGWFSGFGSGESRGTLLFSLNGDIRRPGVYEYPLGIPLNLLLEEAGGGIPDGRGLKAVFPGGPSFGLLKGDRSDTPLSFESLKEAGSGLGAGAVQVFDESRCMVKAALQYASFFKKECCRQCPPCEMGTHNLATLLARIFEGRPGPTDLDSALKLCEWMPGRGACGLVTGAAVSIGSLLRHFREEFEGHARGEALSFYMTLKKAHLRPQRDELNPQRTQIVRFRFSSSR